MPIVSAAPPVLVAALEGPLSCGSGYRGGGRLEGFVGEHALGELLLGLLETGSCAAVIAVHLYGTFEHSEPASLYACPFFIT